MEWKDKYTTASIFISTFFFIISIVYLVYVKEFFPSPPYMVPINQEMNSQIGSLLILCLLPVAITQHFKENWLDSVDHNVPRFLQDVTEDVKSGQSLIFSLQENAKEDYGSLTTPLQKALTHFKLTADLKNSMTMLGNSLKRSVAKQMSAILIEAYSSGGSVIDILQSSVTLFKSIDDNRNNRKIKTRPYIVVVYISLALFLIVSWVILNRFLIPMNTQTQSVTVLSGLSTGLLEMAYYRSILFWSAITESLIGGLVAGKISRGKISSGILHSVILLTITVSFFTLLM